MDFQPPPSPAPSSNQGVPNTMNYQPMSGQGGVPSGMGMDPMNQNSSHKVWYIIGAVALIVILWAVWYLYYGTPSIPSDTGNSAAIEKVQPTPLSSGDTTNDIMADLGAVSNDTNGLEQSAASSAAAIQGF